MEVKFIAGLLVLGMLVLFLVWACNENNDDDDASGDDDNNSPSDDDDNSPGKLDPCGYSYQEYEGWFEIPDFYHKAEEFWVEFGAGVSADCTASRVAKDLTVDCGSWQFSAKWLAEDGNFPIADGQEVKVNANWINADVGTGYILVFNTDRKPILMQLTDTMHSFEMDGEVVKCDIKQVELCAFSVADPALAFTEAEGAYWDYVNATGVSGNIGESTFVVDRQNLPVSSTDGVYRLRVYKGFYGQFDWPQYKWWNMSLSEIGVQMVIDQ